MCVCVYMCVCIYIYIYIYIISIYIYIYIYVHTHTYMTCFRNPLLNKMIRGGHSLTLGQKEHKPSRITMTIHKIDFAWRS